MFASFTPAGYAPLVMPALESSYTRLRELGRGGMGVVTLARQHSLNRLVAVKELLADDDFAELAKRFAREASALARLSHPGVVRLLDFDLAHEPPYLVCEYVEDARPLSELLAERTLEREAAVALALEIADALAHVHAAGLMHRDLKPANVLVDRGGHARLIDFGLARRVTPEDSRLTQSGHLIGTFTYMSPEQMARREADARADVYAFGLLVYEMLAGELVFAAGARRQVAPGQRWMGQVPALQERAAGVAPALAEVVERCLAVEPAKRYANGGELASALERALRERATAITWEPNDPPGSRLLVVAAVGGALLGGLAIGLWARPGAGVRAPVSVAAIASPVDEGLVDLARRAAELEPRRPVRTRAELAVLRTEATRRFARLLEEAPRVLDSETVAVDVKKAVYAGLARLRLLDRILMLNGLDGLEADRALGSTFAPGVPAWLDLRRHELGLAASVVKFKQVGVELPGLMKDIIEVSTTGEERVGVDLSTPPSSLKWAAVHLRVPRLGRRDVLWVTVNGVAFMMDDRSMAGQDGSDRIIGHFLDPRMLRMTGNMIAVAHEPLRGEGSASILRLSTQVGIAGSVRGFTK